MLRESVSPALCPHCGRVLQEGTVDAACDHCGETLAPWLLLDRPRRRSGRREARLAVDLPLVRRLSLSAALVNVLAGFAFRGVGLAYGLASSDLLLTTERMSCNLAPILLLLAGVEGVGYGLMRIRRKDANVYGLALGGAVIGCVGAGLGEIFFTLLDMVLILVYLLPHAIGGDFGAATATLFAIVSHVPQVFIFSSGGLISGGLSAGLIGALLRRRIIRSDAR
jgi:hypothetical protein